MPWLLASPGYQQPSYWLSVSYMKEDLNYPCHIQPAMSHASEGPRNRLLTFVNAEIILPSFEFSSRGIIHQHVSAMGDYIRSAYIRKNVFIENFKELPKPNLMDFLYILDTSKTSWFGSFNMQTTSDVWGRCRHCGPVHLVVCIPRLRSHKILLLLHHLTTVSYGSFADVFLSI